MPVAVAVPQAAIKLAPAVPEAMAVAEQVQTTPQMDLTAAPQQ
jgi:hypothetical protein